MLLNAIKESKAKNAKAVRALLDIEAIKASKNQAADIAAALEKVKEENDYLFTSDEPIDNPIIVGKSEGGAAAKTVQDLTNMSYSDYKKWRNEN